MYLVRMTRIDCLYAVSMLSRYQNRPSIRHWNAIQRICRYLFNTMDKGLIFYPEHMATNIDPLICMVDASNGVSIDNFDGTTGYCLYYYGTCVLAKSRKQNVHTHSSTESEYIAMSEASRDCIHLANVARALGVAIDNPVAICSDSKPCISQTIDENFRTKYRQICTVRLTM